MTLIRPILLAVLVAVSLPAPAADKAADAEDAAYRQMIANQRKSFERMVERYPELRPGKTVRMDEIVRLSVRDGSLVMTSPLAGGPDAAKFKNGQTRVHVDGLAGPALVMCQNAARMGIAGGHQNEWFVSFSHTTFGPDGQTNYHVGTQPGLIQIGRNIGSARRNANVNLQQQTGGRPELGQEVGVTLSVYEGDNMGGRPPTQVNIRVKDFAELRRKYPREVDQYVRPVLKELRLEGLFTIDHALAWQVFTAEWRRDPALERRVTGLVAALDANEWAERERAMAALRALGPDAGLMLYHMGRDGLSLEQAGRVDAVVAAHALAPRDQAQRMAADPDFLLDCLYSDEQPVRAVAVARLAKLAGRPLALDPDAPKDARLAQIETLRREMAPKPKPATAPATMPAKSL